MLDFFYIKTDYLFCKILLIPFITYTMITKISSLSSDQGFGCGTYTLNDNLSSEVFKDYERSKFLKKCIKLLLHTFK